MHTVGAWMARGMPPRVWSVQAQPQQHSTFKIVRSRSIAFFGATVNQVIVADPPKPICHLHISAENPKPAARTHTLHTRAPLERPPHAPTLPVLHTVHTRTIQDAVSQHTCHVDSHAARGGGSRQTAIYPIKKTANRAMGNIK